MEYVKSPKPQPTVTRELLEPGLHILARPAQRQRHRPQAAEQGVPKGEPEPADVTQR